MNETGTERPVIRVSSYGAGKFCLDGLSEEDVDRLTGMMAGINWVRVVGGKLEVVSSHTKLPDPIEDDLMLPFWRKPTPGQTSESRMLFDPEQLKPHSMPSITIHSLCGYNYSPENYKEQARRLRALGFEQLRSPRDENSGQYWEHWHLFDLSMAKNELADAIKPGKDSGEKVDLALRFLARAVQFGSLDVSNQRLAMVMDD